MTQEHQQIVGDVLHVVGHQPGVYADERRWEGG